MLSNKLLCLVQLYASNEIMQPVIKNILQHQAQNNRRRKRKAVRWYIWKVPKEVFLRVFFFCVCVFCVVFVVHLFVSSAPPVFEFLLKERVCWIILLLWIFEKSLLVLEFLLLLFELLSFSNVTSLPMLLFLKHLIHNNTGHT